LRLGEKLIDFEAKSEARGREWKRGTRLRSRLRRRKLELRGMRLRFERREILRLRFERLEWENGGATRVWVSPNPWDSVSPVTTKNIIYYLFFYFIKPYEKSKKTIENIKTFKKCKGITIFLTGSRNLRGVGYFPDPHLEVLTLTP